MGPVIVCALGIANGDFIVNPNAFKKKGRQMPALQTMVLAISPARAQSPKRQSPSR